LGYAGSGRRRPLCSAEFRIVVATTWQRFGRSGCAPTLASELACLLNFRSPLPLQDCAQLRSPQWDPMDPQHHRRKSMTSPNARLAMLTRWATETVTDEPEWSVEDSEPMHLADGKSNMRCD